MAKSTPHFNDMMRARGGMGASAPVKAPRAPAPARAPAPPAGGKKPPPFARDADKDGM